MAQSTPNRAEVDRFILEHIDSVSHLEALLLLWREREEDWTVDALAKRLWIELAEARTILQDLSREQLVALETDPPERCKFRSEPENERLINAVDKVYRKETIRISRMIHARPSSVRAFARAFRFTKEQE